MKTIFALLLSILIVVGCGAEPEQIVCSTGSDGIEICREMTCYTLESTTCQSLYQKDICTVCYDTCRQRVGGGWIWFECT